MTHDSELNPFAIKELNPLAIQSVEKIGKTGMGYEHSM